MEFMMFFIENIAMFEIINDIFAVTLGAGLCYGSLKWRKGLITTVSLYWGLVLGITLGVGMSGAFDSPVWLFICGIFGTIIFPILTYRIPAINRFVVGFLVAMKLTFMITTLALKAGSIGIIEMLMIPLTMGIIVGLILMFWTQIRVSAFVLFCAFLGAAQIAPTVAKYINQISYGIQGGAIFDPYDIIFALFGIELTDFWTLIVLLICMITGVIYHLKSIKEQGYSFDTPLISYETDDAGKHGRIN